MVELRVPSVGDSYLSATDGGLPMQAYVPDGMPKLEDGSVVLFRAGDTGILTGFDPKNTAPTSGMNNVVVSEVMGPGWKGIGSKFRQRPTVAYNKSPWLRMPWPESVQHYALHFTPFWKVDEKAGTCEQLRPFPNPGNPLYQGYPKWPARVDVK